MRIFEIKRKFFKSQKFLSSLVLLPFLVFLPKNHSKTLTSEAFDTKKHSILLNSLRNVQTDTEMSATTTSGGSIFVKVLTGIGSFFVRIGSGIAVTVMFLGRMIAFPVTATIGLFGSSSTPAAAA